MRILGYRKANGEAITVADKDWLQHVYAIGGTGAGKTTWLEGLMADDLTARRGFCYIDKHGDSAKRIADSSPLPILYWRPTDLSFVISLNPLQNVPPDERWKVTANIVSVFADIWELGEHTPRLTYYLRAAVRLLLDTHGTTLLDIRRVLSDHAFRRRLMKKSRDAETLQTWAEFEAKDARQQAQEVGSLQNKVAALADALPLRLIIGQQTSTINIRRIVDSGTVMVCDLSGMGDEGASLGRASSIVVRAGCGGALRHCGIRAKELHALYRRIPELRLARLCEGAQRGAQMAFVDRASPPVHRANIREAAA
jgi:hypothetical protein